MTQARRVLFLFAHQDDEFGVAPWIVQEIRQGSIIRCIYLTDGGDRWRPGVRDEESLAALDAIGVRSRFVTFVENGGERIQDRFLVFGLEEALAAVRYWLKDGAFFPDRIYAPSYEGGHPDHDAAHLIAAVIADEIGILEDSWHFSLYNAYRCPAPLFRTLCQLPSKCAYRASDLSFRERLDLTFLCARYRSQWRTWIGLLPGAILERVVLSRERVVRFDVSRLRMRPHPGPLLYERRFGMRYSDFYDSSRAFVERISGIR